MLLGKLLEEITGIDPGILGEKNLARTMRERMSVCKLADEKQYLERVRSSSMEMEILIEAVVIPETSFFRDKGPFTYLGRYIRDEWMRKPASGLLRILSAPCSSGEEPYSIAIALQEAGLKPDEYQVDAVDISHALLDKAARALYSQHSFRGVPEPLRDRYFVQAEREYILKDAVRHEVHFIHGNLLDKRILDGRRYDIVFCRNLLIYFGPEARTRLMNTIERLLVRDGLLFVGHAETSCFPGAKYEPLDDRSAFGFRKVEREAAAMDIESQTAIPLRLPFQMKPIGRQEVKQPPIQAPDDSKRKDSFQEAKQMADRGHLTEALEICERLLLTDGTDANVYSLLGIVQHGLGNLNRAEECFTRAIYLDARCYDAMIHLSLIKEYRGDSTGAKALKRRAARVQPQIGTS
jgi:chemotaxis protein methyltransferase WspC